MLRGLLFNLAALAALAPAALVHRSARGERDVVFWAALGVAAAGAASWSVALLAGGWQGGLSAALWVSISTTLVIFIVLAAVSAEAWRLTPLLLPYLLLLAIVATVWAQAPARPLLGAVPPAWLVVHIVASVLTYALMTVAAVAAVAVAVQERALKRKKPIGRTRLLPSIADCEVLQIRLLAAGQIVLGAGLLTGMAAQYVSDGRLVAFEHKTLFAFLAFVVIGILLLAHWRTGVRGRSVARFVLLAYLFLTLAYPGVKFVTDVLMA